LSHFSDDRIIALAMISSILGFNPAMADGSVLGRGAWMQVNAALGYGIKIEAGRVLVPTRHRGLYLNSNKITYGIACRFLFSHWRPQSAAS